jgi:hypothetical protein
MSLGGPFWQDAPAINWSAPLKKSLLALAVLAFSQSAVATLRADPVSHDHMGTNAHQATIPAPRVATEPGQGAFAAIQEIVDILAADPRTDWSKVDIDALRAHLVDMDNVTLRARVATIPVKGGLRFVVTGQGDVAGSIDRMVRAHAATMNGMNGMTIVAGAHKGGAVMTVTVKSKADLARLKAIGFFGVMALGMHHQAHHLMIASGHSPHH